MISLSSAMAAAGSFWALCTSLICVGCEPSSADVPRHSRSAGDTVIASVSVPPLRAASHSGPPELPRVYVNTQLVPPTGRSVSVRAGDDLQAAINQAQLGDVLLLQPGATFTGNFRLPAKPGSGWITIRSATPDAQLPAPGTRLTPRHSALLPKISSPNASPALQTDYGAHHYRLLGLEVTAATSVTLNYGLIRFGDSPQTLAQMPHDLILDRSYVHGHSALHLKNCVTLNSAMSAVIDSYLAQCHGRGQDTQAIIGWNGPGPFKIVNNYLEGAGENVMFGGADPSIPNLVPSDIEFRQNHVTKPVSWKGVWTVKNLLELKNAQRVLIEGNIFENSWVDAQTGWAIVFKSANQSGACTWCITQHVTFRYNRVRNASSGFDIMAHPSAAPAQTANHIHIAHNLIENINAAPFNGNGRIFELNADLYDVTIEHNTAFSVNGSMLISLVALPPLINFAFRDNVASRGNFGIKGSGTSEGNASLVMYATNPDVRGNVIIGAPAAVYPPLNFFPSTMANVGFISSSTGDYRLAAGSPYSGRATDGRDPGADIPAVLNATQPVIVP